jgi:hypothetical protein
MLNYIRFADNPLEFPDSPIIYDSHDDYTPDPVEPEPSFVEEPMFLAVNRLSALEFMRIHS